MYLNCKTYYSFQYGTFGTEELVKKAVSLGVNALALTNINSTCDAWDFVKHCREENIKPILGAEIRNEDTLLYILIAANNRGFSRINRFLSEHFLENKLFPETPGGDFFYFPGDGFVIYPLQAKRADKLLPNEFIGILPGELTKLYSLRNKNINDRLVIRQPVTFQSKGYYNIHKLLRCIDKNILLSKLTPQDTCSQYEYFIPPHELLETFKEYPFIVSNTFLLMDQCSIEMEFWKDKNKKVFGHSMAEDRSQLAKLSWEGLMKRYGKDNKAANERLEKELRIINDMGFNAYFLMTWDIIQFGRSKGYFHVGRGSGANSMVAYCLEITDVDPIELDLYFERFLNPHRASPPDFDIDFSWADRNDITEYIFQRHGQEHVALLGSYATFQYNAIIRELGKVFGLPKSDMDELAQKGYYNGDSRSENFMNRTNEDRIRRTILQYGKYMQDFPNHLSIHAGGILVSDTPIYDYTALYLPPKGFATTQIDMYISEDIGLYKLDLLSQRGLGHIKDAIDIVKQNRGIDINIHEIETFKNDPQIRAHIRDGNTIGCFYIESPAMRHVLKKLNCEDYITLVAASSIIRPGVGRSGMMNEYIRRFHDPSKIKYPHPGLEPLLKETMGVMIYQEQVIMVAHFWAGLDMSDADILRRSTSFKNRLKGGIYRLKEKFFSSCALRKYPLEATTEVWRQIESFGDFSFCKAHSASFAVESYQSLFLKTHFPMEFMVAVINNFGGFYSHGNREVYFYELMRAGGIVEPPCVQHSDYLTNIRGKNVYVGFVQVKGLEKDLIEKIIIERKQFGPYLNLEDFIARTRATREQLYLLVRVGALRFTGYNKKRLLWEADFLLRGKNHLAARSSLFHEGAKKFSLPQLPIYPLDDVYDQVELLGFPVCNPFTLTDEDPHQYVSAAELKNHTGKLVSVLGYHITQKPVRTIHGETMSFGTFIDVNKDWIDTVHFPPIYKKAPPQSGFYRITGKVVEEFGVYSIEVTDIEKAGIKKRKPEETL